MLSHDEYKAIFDGSPDGCVVVAHDGRIRGVNPRIENLFGWGATQLVGQSVEVLIPKGLRARHQLHREGFAANPHNRPMGVGLDLNGQRRDGSTFPVEVSLSPWRHEDGGLSIICTVRDVTAYRRLRNFSKGAMRASEDERHRIARELHDDTAQRLATLILRVRVLADEQDAAARSGLFEAVRAEIIEASDGVKRLSRGLRPPEIEELGLELAVQAHARSLQETGDFVIQTDLGVVDPYLDVGTKLALYRVVQEALSNARKHAGTDSATVRLFRDGNEVIVEIRDEGRGFSPEQATDGRRGLGLIGMQERVAMIGGRLRIVADQGEGTLVRVSVPVEPTEAADG